MSQFFDRLNEGGPFFMYTILLLLILIFVLIIKGFTKDNLKKTLALISSLSIFALVWGFLGHLLSLVGAIDVLEAAEDISPTVMASGIKVSLLTTIFGAITFLVGRLGMILLIWTKK